MNPWIPKETKPQLANSPCDEILDMDALDGEDNKETIVGVLQDVINCLAKNCAA